MTDTAATENRGTVSAPDLSGLFEPIQIRGLTLPNRVVMAPMGHQNSLGGVHRPGMARFFARRAEGGVGLITSDATAVPHRVAAMGYALHAFLWHRGARILEADHHRGQGGGRPDDAAALACRISA